MTATYVVTNFRFDDEFWHLCMTKFKQQEPLPLECEEILTDTPPRKTRFSVTIELLSNAHHVFTCHGYYQDGSCRLEENNGTLYLSVI